MAKSSPTEQDWHYETAIARVEHLVKQIEGGELDLADVFDRFAAANSDLDRCEAFLADKQTQVDLAIETLGDSPA
ncbi:MAG: exodeoxyribonuclease VII small subunit [Geitlerinemataceae cyanobacterium]|mgnify:FL=1